MTSGRAERPEAADGIPVELTRQVETVARYQAAVARHLRTVSSASELRTRRGELMHMGDVSREIRDRREALHLATERLTDARAALQDEVTRYVRALKDGGLPPERVLVVVKAGVLASDSGGLPLRDMEQLAAEASQWTIDAYYAAA